MAFLGGHESGAAGRKVFSPLHLRTRCTQVREVQQAAEAARSRVQARRDALAGALAPRLWCPPSLIARVLDGPQTTLATLSGLIDRLAACDAGFAALPVDPRATAEAPAPVALV